MGYGGTPQGVSGRSTTGGRPVVPGWWLALFLCANAFAVDLYRIVYTDDPNLKDRQILEQAYGAKLYVIPLDAKPPARPEVVDGIVLHLDFASDSQWVMGTRNPMKDYAELKARISRAFPGIQDIDEKWDEFRFLSEVAPELAPPEMQLGNRFDPLNVPERRRLEIATKVNDVLREHPTAPSDLRLRLIRLEAMREIINQKMGKAILKVRDFSHSEGQLPKSTEDWLTLYTNYYLETAPRVRELEKETESSSVSLDHAVVNLPHIEGRVLEVLLDGPERVIVQKMIAIETEVRVHIVEGKILEGGTFLRFYDDGQFLDSRDTDRIHRTLRERLLPQMQERFGAFSCTADVVIEKGTGKISILDMNGGLESGYYYPEEDLFTTNYLHRHLTGETPLLLKEWEEVAQGTLETDLGDRIARFLKKYERFVSEENESAFWDRAIELVFKDLARAPTAERLKAAIQHLKRSGMVNEFEQARFRAQVQATWPGLVETRGGAVSCSSVLSRAAG